MTIEVPHGYETRRVRFLELWEHGAWRVKVYGMSAFSERPDEALVDAARRIAAERLPPDPANAKSYGVAYLIVHEGENGDYVILDWWYDRDIVQHHLYGAPKGHGGALRYRWPEGAGFCVWELGVIWHERQAWIDTVLDRPGRPHLDAYLGRRMNGEV